MVPVQYVHVLPHDPLLLTTLICHAMVPVQRILPHDPLLLTTLICHAMVPVQRILPHDPLLLTTLICHAMVGFTIPKNFSSYNIPKVTASTTRQVLISNRTVTFSESSSLRGKRACNILQKCPPTQKIGITCFL